MTEAHESLLHKYADISRKSEWVSPFRATRPRVSQPKKDEVKEKAGDEAIEGDTKGEVEAEAEAELETEPIEVEAKEDDAETGKEGGVEATGASEPAEPAEPGEPVEPAEPAEPSEPAEPAEPSETAETTETAAETTASIPAVAGSSSSVPSSVGNEDGDMVRESRFGSSSSSSGSSSSSSSSDSSAHVIPLSTTDPNIKTFESKPKLLTRYKENIHMARQSMNKNKMENRDRYIGLGSGLAMTEDRLYEIAKKRVQPMLKDVDAYVEKQNAEDAVKREQVHQNYTHKDEQKVGKQLDKYKKQLDKENLLHKGEHEQTLGVLLGKMEQSKKDHEDYVAGVKTQMETDITDSEAAESLAAKTHQEDIDKLISDSDELKQTTIKELVDTKQNEVKETEDAKRFDEDGHKFQTEADEKEAELEKKKAEIDEITKKLQAAIDLKHGEKNKIREAVKQKKIYERNIAIVGARRSRAAANNDTLHSHLGLLQGLIAKRNSQLDELKGVQKEKLVSKKKDAEVERENWEKETAQIKNEEAKKQERIKAHNTEERKRLDEEAAEQKRRAAEKKANRLSFGRRLAVGLGLAGAAGGAIGGVAVAAAATATSAGASGVSKTASGAKAVVESAAKSVVNPGDKVPELKSVKSTKSIKSDKAAPSSLNSPPATSQVTSSAQEEDSLESPKVLRKPVFTEVVALPESNKAPSEYDDVVTYQTVSKEEYEAHKNDPDYLVM